MAIYAILNKDTNVVKNVVVVENENFIFLNSDEYYVLGNKAVEIGMTYNKKTKSFPEVGDRGDLLDLRDQIDVLANEEREILGKDLIDEDLTSHQNYLTELQTIRSLEVYSTAKSQFDALVRPTEAREKKQITQEEFRSVLKLTEKILWDNPETGTVQQASTINTIKSDFPYDTLESMTDEFELLEQVGFFTAQRVDEVKQALS